MAKYTQYSQHASLVLFTKWFKKTGIWKTVEQHVQIQQKVIKHKPSDKLLDILINILLGGQGITEINTRVRPETAVQQAFGRQGCADQSTVSQTLNACDQTVVEQFRQALSQIYGRYGRGYRHPYSKRWQVLDVDLTGMPAGRQGEGVTKGYFSERKTRRGRQLGRVLASLYDEIVVEQLYAGTVQLEQSMQGLVRAAEEVLDLAPRKRRRTILRLDGGAGDDKDINFALERGYQLIAKVKNWQRSQKLCKTVTTWYPDPKVPGREFGWIGTPHVYVGRTHQLGIRWRKEDGSWRCRVLVFNLSHAALYYLIEKTPPTHPTPFQIMHAAMEAYDRRGGGVETSNKNSKQGLGLTKRNKRSSAAQEMLVLLAQLVYNLLAWFRETLAVGVPKFKRFGMLRLIRDVLAISGKVCVDDQGRIIKIILNKDHILAKEVKHSLTINPGPNDMSLILGKI